MKDLGTLGGDSAGYALNATGQVVGVSGAHAFFYNGVRIDINSIIDPADPVKALVTLTGARGINDRRLVVVNGR
jgi:hypothetical protein